MRGRYIALILLAWMVLIAAYGLSHHSSGGHKTTRLSLPPGATTPSQTTTGSETAPTPSFAGGGSNGTGATTPAVTGAAPGDTPTPAPSPTGPAQQQNIAVSGWPAVAFMPYRDKTVRAELDLFAGGKAHVSVYYNTTLAAGRKAFVSFLHRHHDRAGHYAIRYFPRSIVKQQAAQQSQVDLAFSGYKMIVRLPDHYGKTTLTFAGKHGREVLIGYTGPRPAALKRLRYWVKVYDDTISHYTLVKR